MQQQQISTAVNNRVRTRTVLSDTEKEQVIEMFNSGVMIKDISTKIGVGHVYISNILSKHYSIPKTNCSCEYCEKEDIPQYRMKSPKMCFDCFFIRKKKCDELYAIRKELGMDKLHGDSHTIQILHVKICEEYIGNELSIADVSRKLVVSEGMVLIALKKYYGKAFKTTNLRYK